MALMGTRLLPVTLAAPLVVALMLWSGCDQQTPTPPQARTDKSMRIVSLAPALTQMVVDLGRGNLIVGVAQYDDAAPPGLPVLGNYQDINTEALLSVAPTHVLTMTSHDAVPQHLSRIAAAGGFRLVAYPPPLSVSDIVKIIYDEQELIPGLNPTSAQCLAAVLGTHERGLELVNQMSMRLARLANLTADAKVRNVLMVIGVNPLMASGPGTTLDQLLSFCGAENAAANATVGAPVYDKEKLLRADPDVILMLLPGAAPLGSLQTDPRLAQLRDVPITAVEQNRIVLINDPLVHLPSSSLPRIGVAMAKAIHPELADAINRATSANPSATARNRSPHTPRPHTEPRLP